MKKKLYSETALVTYFQRTFLFVENSLATLQVMKQFLVIDFKVSRCLLGTQLLVIFQ